jgi:L-fuconolactonase
MKRLDSHHHFWHYKPEKFPWITPERAVVGRDFLPGEFRQVLSAGGVDGSIVVQNFRTMAETDWLLGLAKEFPGIEAVVGWFPLIDPAVETTIERYAVDPLVVGAREILQYPELSGYFEDPAFHRGLEALAKHGLTYDLLIGPWQMHASIRLVDRHPKLQFVLDHMGKPPIASGDLEEWSQDFREIARRPNVACKFSGLPLESKLPGWRPVDFQPCIDLALEVFGPSRLMFGSDWPPCLMATTYARWVEVVAAAVANLAQEEQAAIWARTAERIYGLND